MNFGRVSGARIALLLLREWRRSVGWSVGWSSRIFLFLFSVFWVGDLVAPLVIQQLRIPSCQLFSRRACCTHTHAAAVHVAVTRDYINALGAHHVNRSSRKIFDWLFSHTRKPIKLVEKIDTTSAKIVTNAGQMGKDAGSGPSRSRQMSKMLVCCTD